MVPLINHIHWVMHSVVGQKVAAVQNSAQASGGFCTWRFSQVRDPVKSLICSNQYTSGGICEMLAAKWLEAHATGGSIVNWILDGGGESIDANKIRQLMQLFAIGTTMKSGAMTGNPNEGWADQTLATERWLRAHGVVRRRHLTGGVAMLGGGFFHQPRQTSRQRGNVSRRNFAREIARSIVDGAGSYMMIDIRSSHFAHAMAAWCDQDVSFFDPNFGEFWFARPADFEAWFPTYWQLTGYANPLVGLSESYCIDEYARAA